MKDFIQSPVFDRLIRLLAVLLLALIVFGAGMAVGYRKAMFSYRWNDSYAQQFGGPHSPFMIPGGPGDRDDASNPHGAAGTIVTVRLPMIVVKGPGGPEEQVLIGTTTSIRRFHDVAASTTLRAGDAVIIIGEPNDEGQIEASFVRVIPQPPRASSTSTN